MIFDGVDTDVFQYYLDYLAQEIPAVDSKRRLLIVDNASWHKSQRLNWHHFEVHYLPGYSPDFNPDPTALGDASKPTSLATSSLRTPMNSPSVFVMLSPPS